MSEAISQYNPVAKFVGFSGGTDSLAIMHWMASRYPDVMAFHANTGIGVEKTRQYVRDVCKQYGWPLVEIFAKEDCGQDYDEIILKNGFPGPSMHARMYQRLKERCVAELLRRFKTKRSDKILIATGIRHDESRIRAGYAGREVNKVGAQVWVNPIYWWTGTDKHRYIEENNLPRNPVAELLGMSGECLCGAFAHKGEKELVRLVDPEIVERIERLEQACLRKGMTWGWEGHPPEGGFNPDQMMLDVETEQPMCVDCNKAGRAYFEQNSDSA